jgi:nitrite reductase (NADH) small subunit
VAGSGVCALINDAQVALFYLPDETPALYAVQNRDPIGEANVMSRGIAGDINGELVVASPLYKQHFSLLTGQCIENPDVCLEVYAVTISGDEVLLLD